MLETRTARIELAASGAVVAAVPGKSIRVLGYILSALSANNVTFQTGGGANISAIHYLAATGGFAVPLTEYGWFQTVAGEALNLNLSAATAVSGSVIYAVV